MHKHHFLISNALVMKLNLSFFLLPYRSGKYCYQPLLKETCCAQYAIRCEALNFQLTRSQKKVLKRIKHFLLTGVKPKQRKADVLSQTNVRLEPNLALHRGEISIPKEIQGVDEVVTKSLQNSTNESQLNTSNLKSLSFNEPIKESKGISNFNALKSIKHKHSVYLCKLNCIPFI